MLPALLTALDHTDRGFQRIGRNPGLTSADIAKQTETSTSLLAGVFGDVAGTGGITPAKVAGILRKFCRRVCGGRYIDYHPRRARGCRWYVAVGTPPLPDAGGRPDGSDGDGD